MDTAVSMGGLFVLQQINLSRLSMFPSIDCRKRTCFSHNKSLEKTKPRILISDPTLTRTITSTADLKNFYFSYRSNRTGHTGPFVYLFIHYIQIPFHRHWFMKSILRTRNQTTESGEPCGTPLSSDQICDKCPSIFTTILLSDRKDFKQSPRNTPFAQLLNNSSPYNPVKGYTPRPGGKAC